MVKILSKNRKVAGQYGFPKFEIGLILGMGGGMIASVVESVGDYQVCARVCQEQPPPSHAVSRYIVQNSRRT